MDFLSAVSVVSISTFSLREVEISSADAMVSVFSRVFCHFGLWILRISGVGVGLGIGGERG